MTSHQMQINNETEIHCQFRRSRGTAHSEPEWSMKEGFTEMGIMPTLQGMQQMSPEACVLKHMALNGGAMQGDTTLLQVGSS